MLGRPNLKQWGVVILGLILIITVIRTLGCNSESNKTPENFYENQKVKQDSIDSKTLQIKFLENSISDKKALSSSLDKEITAKKDLLNYLNTRSKQVKNEKDKILNAPDPIANDSLGTELQKKFLDRGVPTDIGG